MPRKNYKNQIMQTLKQYHNPFRLTAEELQQADALLTEIESGENWMESLQTLADMLEVLPLEIHENQEDYEAAVQRDAALEHQPIHVSAASERDNVLDALAKELEFQRSHELYRYMNDLLRDNDDPETQHALLAAYQNLSDSTERPHFKESVTAVLDNYSRVHGTPDLNSVPQKRVREAEDNLISGFEREGWMLGYGGPDMMNISRVLNTFKKKTGNQELNKKEARNYKRVKNALTKIHELDAEFQENMKAFTALWSNDPKKRKDPKQSSLNELIDDVRRGLNMVYDHDGFSLDRLFLEKENYNLDIVEKILNTTMDDLFYQWRKHSSDKPKLRGREKARFETTERLRKTMREIHGYLDDLYENGIDLRDYTVTSKWLPNDCLMEYDNNELVPAGFYENRLEKWHDRKLQRNPALAEAEEPEAEQEELKTEQEEPKVEQEAEKTTEKEVKKEEPVAAAQIKEQVQPVQPAVKQVILPTSGKEFYEGYGAFLKKHDEAARKKINSNNIEELLALYNSNDMDAAGKDYLAHRVTELEKIHKLGAESVPGRTPQVQPAEDGSIVLPTVQAAKQNSNRGCWSVSLATQLQYRGVELDQKTIRAFRPDTEFFDEKEVEYANKDSANYMENYAELVQEVLPDTAVNSFTFERTEKAEDAEKYLRACLNRALVEDHAPLSIVFNGHYRTIFGIQKDPNGDAGKDVLLFHDPSDPDVQSATVQDFVDLCDKNVGARGQNYQTDPNYKPAYQFSASWLQDLHMNEKGELGGKLQSMGVSYENGRLQCAQPGLVLMSGEKLQTISGEKLVPGKEDEIHTFLPIKSYALLKAEREKAQQAEAEKQAAEKQAAEVQPKQQEAVEVQKAELQEKAVEKPAAKAEKEQQAEDISTDSKTAEKSAAKAEKEQQAEDISTESKTAEEPSGVAVKAAEIYTWKLAETANRLQRYMDVMVETNTASQWEKSSESYKKLYNTLRSMKGDEKGFFTALRKETPQKVQEMMAALETARRDYLKDAARLMKKDPMREQNRVAAAEDMGKYLPDMRWKCNAASSLCQNFDVPAYIDKLVEAERVKAAEKKQPVKLTAKELENKVKVAKQYADFEVKESKVEGWTSLELVQGNKKSTGAKTKSKKKSL